MRERFGNEETWRIWNGEATKATRRLLPQQLHTKAQRQLNRVVLAAKPTDCAIFKSFKMLQRRRTYQFQIDGQYRVRFDWENGEAVRIETGDFHDEDE